MDIWGWRSSRWPILGHFRPFPTSSGTIHGPRWSRLSFKRPFYIGNHYCFTKICPKFDIWGWRLSRWPILGHFLPFSAISGHVHGPRWSRLCFNRPFFSENQCCFNNICPKIDIWGWSWSRWPILGHFLPFLATYMVWDGPGWASSIYFLVGINVALTICALKSISEAADAPDGQVLAVPGPHGVRDGRHQNKKWSEFHFAATSKT